MNKPTFRVGFGFDVHQLEAGKDFWLGGIKIEHSKGIVGHSDADVLIHAVCDALLGAAGLRDIGHYFPNTDPKYKGIDSKKLLKEVVDKLTENGFGIGNLDCTVCAEQPKINPHIDEMKSVLAPILHVDNSDISIKATTNEKMGFIGREEGITAYAVTMIYRKSG